MIQVSNDDIDTHFPRLFASRSWSEPAACRLQRLHELPCAPFYFRQIVLGTKQLGSESEARGAGRKPGRDICGADTTYRKDPDRRRQYGAQCLQVPRTMSDRWKEFQSCRAGTD